MAEPAVMIRRMRQDDVAAVMVLDRQCFPVPWSANGFVAEMGNVSAYYLVAEAGSLVCGYAGSWMIADEAHITTLGVDPRLRRRGIGELLLKAVLEEAARRGVRRVSLEVRVSNAVAQRMYEKFGFTPVGRRAGYYTDNGEDALVMWIGDLIGGGRSSARAWD
jgi:ribosomal-protein-alanine N-acetyltransferase